MSGERKQSDAAEVASSAETVMLACRERGESLRTAAAVDTESRKAMASSATALKGQTRHLLLALAAAFSLLALGYNIVVPVFNAPDEPYHFEYIQYVERHRALPDQSQRKTSINVEGFHPPLYYIVGALFLPQFSSRRASDLVIPSARDVYRFRSNPNSKFRRPLNPPLNWQYKKWGWGEQLNMFQRLPQDRFPFRGSWRSIHLLRLVSLPFGIATLFFLFKTAELLYPKDRSVAVLATAICAFNPQFTFLHAYINNDTLATALSTMAFWYLSRFTLDEKDDPRLLIRLGLCTGFALLTKINVVFLLPVALLAILLRAGGVRVLRDRGLPYLLRSGLLFLLPLVIACGWYYLRSALVYGLDDPLGWNLRARQNPQLAMVPELRNAFFQEVFFQQAFTSYWGRFDWLTILLPAWQYWIYGLISCMGLVGIMSLIQRAARGRDFTARDVCLSILLFASLLAVGALINANLTLIAAQGRLLFPVMGPLSIFMAIGLSSAIRRMERVRPLQRRYLVAAIVIAMGGLNLHALFNVIVPAYS
ncbi:MAG: hypothetical protein CL908_04920 [Deltaproteobacteria bacterium]|nr:hypothetical protein [Deltaproteobacteria bacterium]